jgi:autotransporter-associated beta strand protein
MIFPRTCSLLIFSLCLFLPLIGAQAQSLAIDSLTGPVTQNEISSFKAYMLTQIPPPTPFGIYNATNGDHNDWADFGGGNALESFGLMYEVTGDITILTNMIHWTDICISERNDLLPAAQGGQRVMWTNGIAKVWVPNETNSAGAAYAGGENGDTKAHILYTALLILQNPSLWNQTIPDGNPFGYGVTYFQRATNYVGKCDEANDNYDYIFFSPSNTIANPPTWPAGYHTMFANNIQMMMLGDFQRSAQCHQILGDAPARVAYYNLVCSNAYLQCINGMAAYQPGTTNGSSVYNWAYYPYSKYHSDEENVGHGAYDMVGVWRAYNVGAYGFAESRVLPFANAEAYVMYVATNTFSGNVDGSGTTQNYMQAQWFFLADWNPAVYTVTAEADYASGRYQSTDLMTAIILWMKNRRYRQFSITPTPASQTISIGGATNFTLAVAALGAMTNNVGLSVSGLPAGAIGTFSSSSANLASLNYPATNITLSITTSGTTPAGIYPLAITGTNGAVTHTNFVTLVVGNYSLSAIPSSQTVSAGNSTTYTITVATNAGFNGTVSFGVANVPANTSAGFSPATLVGAGNSTMTISTAANTPSGSYTLTINGTNGAEVAAITVNLNVVGQTPVWNGGSASDNFWNDSANWSGNGITPNAPLIFSGNTRLNNTNNTASGTTYSNIVFNPGAGAFVLNGNLILVNGNLTNNAGNPETFNLGINFTNSLTLNGASAPLVIAGGLTNAWGASGMTTVTLAGSGTLDDDFGSANNPGGTNILTMTNNSANWTIANNPSSTSINTGPWGMQIAAGTMTFGNGVNNPNLNLNTSVSGQDNYVGSLNGGVGTLSINSGTLTTASRWDTGGFNSGSTGIINQNGGTFNIGSQFQGANVVGGTSVVNLAGGTMNINSGNGPFYLASRGNGSLTISGAAGLNCGILDVSRNASGNTVGSVGVLNLDGGAITCSRVGTATANSQTNWQFGSSATVYFNGGTLRASASSATFYQGNTSFPLLPVTSIVQLGGAVMDSSNFSITVLEPLQHDSTLGGDLDGGLTKLGAGTLTLAAPATYNGDTLVRSGTLALSGTASIASSDSIAVMNGATLDASVRTDGTLTLSAGQTLTGNGAVKGNTVVTSGATLSPGGSLSTLTFDNNLTLNGGSTTVFEVSKSPVTNDFAHVTGSLALNGTIFVTNMGATAYAPGDSFKLFSAAGINGAFTSIQPVIPDVNLAWNTNNLSSGILSIVSSPTPLPKIVAATMGAGNFVFTATNGVPNWPCSILASTNLSRPLSQWTVIATNNFDANGNLSVTDQPDPALPQTFYLLQMQ